MLDRFDCYELCVQSPRHVAGFLRGLVSRSGGGGCGPCPILAEDFCGTAALSRRWVADAQRLAEGGELPPGPLALAADLDPDALDRARALAPGQPIEFIRTDLLRNAAAPLPPAHVIFVGNFSIGYIHDRATLVSYLARCKKRLDAVNQGFGCAEAEEGGGGGGGGAFVCDTYGGPGAFRLGSLQRKHPARGREIIHYLWRHDQADPVTAMVTNSISFRIELDGEIIADLPDAFTYRWRLWSLPELREAMLEAGFKRMEVYRDVNIPPGRAPTPAPTPTALEDLSTGAGGDWIVLAAGRV